jgi:hypothetical protein
MIGQKGLKISSLSRWLVLPLVNKTHIAGLSLVKEGPSKRRFHVIDRGNLNKNSDSILMRIFFLFGFLAHIIIINFFIAVVVIIQFKEEEEKDIFFC